MVFHAGLDRLERDLKEVAAKWKPLGIELEVPGDELDEIGAFFGAGDGKAQGCLLGVINEWLQNTHPNAPVTREVLKQALITIGRKVQAENLPAGLLGDHYS